MSKIKYFFFLLKEKVGFMFHAKEHKVYLYFVLLKLVGPERVPMIKYLIKFTVRIIGIENLILA